VPDPFSVPSIVAYARNDLWPDFFYPILREAKIPSIFNLSTQNLGVLIGEFIFFIFILKSAVPWLEQLIASLKAFEDELLSNENDLRYQYDPKKYLGAMAHTPMLRKHLFAARPLF